MTDSGNAQMYRIGASLPASDHSIQREDVPCIILFKTEHVLQWCITLLVPDTSFLASPNAAATFCPTPVTVEKMMISLSIPTISIGGSSTCIVDSNR